VGRALQTLAVRIFTNVNQDLAHRVLDGWFRYKDGLGWQGVQYYVTVAIGVTIRFAVSLNKSSLPKLDRTTYRMPVATLAMLVHF
jgi:hypothetical protein